MNIIEKLNELKRLADAATPGPWELFANISGEEIDGIKGPHGPIVDATVPYEGTGFYRVDDAKFCIASRTALPQLVEALIYAIDILGEEKRFRGIDRIAELLEVKG